MALVLISFFVIGGFGTGSSAVTSTTETVAEEATGTDADGGIGGALSDALAKIRSGTSSKEIDAQYVCCQPNTDSSGDNWKSGTECPSGWENNGIRSQEECLLNNEVACVDIADDCGFVGSVCTCYK